MILHMHCTTNSDYMIFKRSCEIETHVVPSKKSIWKLQLQTCIPDLYVLNIMEHIVTSHMTNQSDKNILYKIKHEF